MGPVIQETQRRNEERHPRWDRLARAERCAPSHARQAQGLSQRPAAPGLDVPRRTLQAWRVSPERRDAGPAVGAFFPRVPGRACRPRLVLALPLVGTAVGAGGRRLVGRRVQSTGRNRWVGAS